MTAAALTGIFILCLLVGLGLGAMASISGWRDVLWALAITAGIAFALLLAITLIYTGMWPWEQGFSEALQ